MPKPRATYRLQLHAGFGLDCAVEIADYLKALGVSHVYSSPYLQAAPGSTHGYDVVDHRSVNEELGGAAAHERLTAKLREVGLGQVLDIVPNHMAISGSRNRWWWDVLENGIASRYANYFDIDWQSPEEKLRNKVTVPILGNQYGRVLEAGEIQLGREAGKFVFCYFDNRLPASPESTAPVLLAAAERAGSNYLAFLASAARQLSAEPLERSRDKEVLSGLLDRLCGEDSKIRECLDAEMACVNRDPDALDRMLERQNYRVAYWRTADRELGYRRFFNINTLVGLRMSLPEVFRDTHALVLQWVSQGVLDGLRVDHPDGLQDPLEYFTRLRDAAPQAWIVAEKILEPGETLPSNWPIAGTVGYDFLNVLSGLFVDPKGEAPLTDFYREFTGDMRTYHEIALEKKAMVLRELLGSDVNRLTAMFMDVCEHRRRHRDYTRHEIHHALREVVTNFPVYRTYVRAAQGEVSAADVASVQCAIRDAATRRPDIDGELLRFLEDVLLLRVRGDLETKFAMQFQQFTGPAMAKGVEDTAFYCYNRLTSLNEVGGDPGTWGTAPEAFHRYCETAPPDGMLASSTHDTKRSEDVRARLCQIAEIPERWKEAVERWSKDHTFGDRNTEYLAYQTMLGAWPFSLERLTQYMEKAVREAKVHTTWTAKNEEYEASLQAFLKGLYSDQAFLEDFEAFVSPLIGPGRVQALAQTLVKLTAPGVPDLYQGTEIWDFSLVDPDNRRPVEYTLRRKLLEQLPGLTPEQVLDRWEEGLPKLWVTWKALAIHDQLGPYRRLDVTGDHAIAFARGAYVTVVPRLVLSRSGDWGSVQLPEGEWRNELTGDFVRDGNLNELFRRFPVALLFNRSAQSAQSAGA